MLNLTPKKQQLRELNMNLKYFNMFSWENILLSNNTVVKLSCSKDIDIILLLNINFYTFTYSLRQSQL